jgi:hypothetical protein
MQTSAIIVAIKSACLRVTGKRVSPVNNDFDSALTAHLADASRENLARHEGDVADHTTRVFGVMACSIRFARSSRLGGTGKEIVLRMTVPPFALTPSGNHPG